MTRTQMSLEYMNMARKKCNFMIRLRYLKVKQSTTRDGKKNMCFLSYYQSYFPFTVEWVMLVTWLFRYGKNNFIFAKVVVVIVVLVIQGTK